LDLNELTSAFTATRYHINEWQAPLVIGKHNANADYWLSQLGYKDGVFITAFNPVSQQLSPAENLKRNELLYEAIKDKAHLSGYGKGVSGEWPSEHGYFVGGLSKEESHTLMGKFRQLAVVFHSVGKTSELIWNPELISSLQ